MSKLGRLVKKQYRDTITVASFLGFTDSAKTYGPKYTIKCRIEQSGWQENKFFSKEHQDYSRISTHENLKRSDLVWLPGTDTDNQDEAIEISRIDEATDLAGNVVQYVVYL